MLFEKNARAVIAARAQDGSTGFGILLDEVGGRDSKPPREPQHLVRGYANGLVMAAILAAIALVRKRTLAFEVELNFRQSVLEGHGSGCL
jgi:hypothetical protein